MAAILPVKSWPSIPSFLLLLLPLLLQLPLLSHHHTHTSKDSDLSLVIGIIMNDIIFYHLYSQQWFIHLILMPLVLDGIFLLPQAPDEYNKQNNCVLVQCYIVAEYYYIFIINFIRKFAYLILKKICINLLSNKLWSW